MQTSMDTDRKRDKEAVAGKMIIQIYSEVSWIIIVENRMISRSVKWRTLAGHHSSPDEV